MIINDIVFWMLAGWRASARMRGTPASCFSLSNWRHSVMICLIVSWVPQLVQIGGSSLFIRCWWVNDECPIRILLIAVSVFLDMFGGEGHARVVFLISFSFVEPSLQARSHMLLVIVLDKDLASCRVKPLSFIASGDVIAWRAL